MKDTDNDNLRDAIEDILKDKNSDKLIISSLFEILPSPKRVKLLIFTFLVLILSFYFVLNVKDPILNTLQVIGNVNVLIVALFAVLITGYSIFQALVSGDTLITLLKVPGEKYSKFKEYNYFFLGFSILFLLTMIINFLIMVVLENMDSSWHISYFNSNLNYFLYSISISLYITFVFNLLIEIKCFIYNLYQIFSINATAQAIEYLKKQDSE